ncbi:MAG: DNA polymerase III subunit beta [Chlorobiales bacterium]|nr:DNA polymerase III subunit beta [Chlorobiales bacterium]
MKFTSPIKTLTEAVNSAVLALPPKAADVRYESISLQLDRNKLSLFATDGDVSLITHTEVESEDKSTVLLNAKKFQDILRNMYDTIAVFKAEKKELDGDMTFSIKTDRGDYRISGTADGTDTSLNGLNFDISFAIPAKELSGLIDKTLFAASTDGMRPAMMGVLFELEPSRIVSVATDGHRLVKVSKKQETGAKQKMKIVIPARVLGIVQKLVEDGDVAISVDTNQLRIQFVFGKTTIVASLISENYPNYEAVIPLENDKRMLVNRANFSGTVKRVARFSSRGDVRLNIDTDSLKVSAENADEGASAEEVLTCDYKSESIMIGFNSQFVEQALNHIDSEEVDFEFSSPTRATLLKPTGERKNDDEILMLIMPVRINI